MIYIYNQLLLNVPAIFWPFKYFLAVFLDFALKSTLAWYFKISKNRLNILFKRSSLLSIVIVYLFDLYDCCRVEISTPVKGAKTMHLWLLPIKRRRAVVANTNNYSLLQIFPHQIPPVVHVGWIFLRICFSKVDFLLAPSCCCILHS